MAVLVSYLRYYDKAPYGCIVANGPNPENIGVSICNPKDKFNKHLARVKAEGRIGKDIKYPNRYVMAGHGAGFVTVNSVRAEIEAGIKRMHERAKKYFKPQPQNQDEALRALVGKMVLISDNRYGDNRVLCGTFIEYCPKLLYKMRFQGTISDDSGISHHEEFPVLPEVALTAEVIEPGPYVHPYIGKWALVNFEGLRVGYLTENSIKDNLNRWPFEFHEVWRLYNDSPGGGSFPPRMGEIVEVYGNAI